MHRLSGSIVTVVLCFHAASPAGVNGSLSPGKSLAMLPTGTVSRIPFQYPLKSGWPSASRGTGFALGGLVGSVRDCADVTVAMDNSDIAAKKRRVMRRSVE